MVDKIVITPEKIRGLGNIIIPKNLSDYIECNDSVIGSKEATINGITNNVMEINYYTNPQIIITAPTSFIPFVNGNDVNIPVKVVDSNNNPLHDVRVDWTVESFDGHFITDDNGNGTFTYAMHTDAQNNKIYNFTVAFNIGQTVHNPSVTNSITVKTGCTLTLARTGYVED